MHISALKTRLRELGALPVHEERVLRRWAMAQPQQGGRRRLEDFLPQALRAELASISDELAGLARLHSRHPAEDGSARLLLTLRDGQQVESVLLPPDRPRRVTSPARAAAAVAHSASLATAGATGRATARATAGGLCVSTQVGCAVGCVFCMTGLGGLQRQLGSAEIVAQVVLARGLRAVNKVVFMGMGEPAHNLDAVMEAIALLGTAGGIGHKNLVFSTVGDPRVFERLQALGAGEVKPALALSLHTSKPALRAELLPRAPRCDPADLVAAGESYARHSGYPIQYQWTLIEGVNDGDDEVEGIVRLLAGKYALMNLIPYNAVAGLPWRRPAAERAAELARALHRRGILTKLRQSAGQEVDAGCGQLRARAGPPQRQVTAIHAA
jgi:23S rRNA (adenine2503-C2)-methyltransferase